MEIYMNKDIATYSDSEDATKTTFSSARKQPRKPKNSLKVTNSQRCSICLDPSLYTDSKLLECVKCNGKYHSMCIPGIESEYECDRCKYANKKNLKSELIK